MNIQTIIDEYFRSMTEQEYLDQDEATRLSNHWNRKRREEFEEFNESHDPPNEEEENENRIVDC